MKMPFESLGLRLCDCCTREQWWALFSRPSERVSPRWD